MTETRPCGQGCGLSAPGTLSLLCPLGTAGFGLRLERGDEASQAKTQEKSVSDGGLGQDPTRLEKQRLLT